MPAGATEAQVYIADSRTMAETPSESIALVVTSPPYWHIKDAEPHIEPPLQQGEPETTHKVVALHNDCTHTPVLLTDSGLAVSLLGIVVPPHLQEQARDYLKRYVIGKRVILRFDPLRGTNETPTPAYLYLTNRLFVNRKMIEMGLAHADRSRGYRYRERFITAEGKRDG